MCTMIIISSIMIIDNLLIYIYMYLSPDELSREDVGKMRQNLRSSASPASRRGRDE